ncbi:PAS domain-containing protein [Actimicrobium antarcticum]|uniref:histidine kinase n=1 Tax=Actimicrobium antarcticum TaxID=1051899 RepID=A0ABP7SVR3_9BURK
MRSKISPVLISSLALVFALVVAGMWGTFYSATLLRKNVAAVEHTDQVFMELESILSTLKDAETGQRGYLLTGKREYLNPYASAVTVLQKKLDALGKLTIDNAVQQKRLRGVRVMTSTKLGELAASITLFDRKGFDAARAIVLLGAGKDVMESLRSAIDVMQAEETTQRLLRQEVAGTNYQRLIMLDFAIGGAALSAILAFLFMLRRYVTSRDERELLCHNYLQTTLASIGDAVITTDGDGNVTNMNAVAETLTGWTQASAAGKPLLSVFRAISASSGHTVDYPALRALRDAPVTRYADDTVLIAKNGTETAIEDCSVAISGQSEDGLALVFRDVAERRRQISQLADSEQQFRELAESIPHLCFMANPDGGIFWYNRRWYDYAGASAEQLAGWGWQSVHDPLVLPQVMARWQSSLLLIEPFEMVFPLRGADGQYRQFLTRVMPLMSEQNQVTRWFGTSTDITAQWETEEDLRQFKFFSDHASDGHFLIDKAGRIRYANDLACERLGYDMSELLMMHISDVDVLLTMTLFQEIFTRGRTTPISPFEGIQRRKDGSTFPVEATATVLEVKGEWMVLKSSRDITERKLAEQNSREALLESVRLQESRAATHAMRAVLYERDRHQQAVDAHAIVSVTDAMGQITYVNDKYCQATGCSREELLGKNHSMFKSGMHPLAFYEEMWQTINGGAIWHGEICNRRPDGRMYWIDASIVPFLDADGLPYQHIMIATDVTSTKLSKQALIVSEERLQRGQEFANMGTWEWNIGTGKFFWSNGVAPLLGQAPGLPEISIDNYLDTVHPDDLPALRTALTACIDDDAPLDIEHRVVWPDRSVFWLLNRGNVVRDADGKASNMVGVVQSINKRKLAEIALIETGQRLRQAQMLARLGHWQITFPDHALYWSEEVYNILGQDAATFTPELTSYQNATHPDDRTLVSESIERSKETGRLDVMYRIVRPDGTIRHVQQQARAERAADGRLLRLSGTVQDMTDYFIAKEQLRQSEERFVMAVEGAGDGIWDWLMPTGELLLSGHCESMLGYVKGELTISIDDWNAGVHPDEQALARQKLDAYLTGETASYSVEFRLRCKDGSFKWVLSRGTVVARDSENLPLRMIGILSDISEQKAVQADLVAARAGAELANLAKSEFLSSMSHELRTPMNAILGFAQLLEHDSRLTDDQQEDVHEILKGGRHLLQLINEVLDLAKVESGTMSLSLESVTLADLVEQCRQLIRPLAQARQITVHCAAPSEAAVRADRTRLKQVLLNLLSNAVKYNHAGGQIRVGVQAAANQRWRVTVADTGIGISAEHLASLFEPFNRLGAEYGTTEGTGIGLTITHRLVHMMGGALGVDSEVGVGSTFWIELPDEAMVTLEASSVSVPADKAHQVRTRRVLCIDDNPANLRLLARLLGTRSDIDLMTAHTPTLGLDLARTHRPELIFLDINMPGMDGYQVLKVLLADDNLKTIPVIAVTANAMLHDIERGRTAGFADYITKPIDVTQFAGVVDNLLNSAKEHPQ